MDPTAALIAKNISQTPQLAIPLEQPQSEAPYEYEEYLQQQGEGNPWNRIRRGLTSSSSGIALGLGPTAADLKARGVSQPDFILDLLEEASEIVGDLPFMAAGAAAGSAGGGVGAAAGGFAAPALVKSIYQEYLDYVESGEKITFAQFLKSLGNVGADTAIAGAEGAVIGTVSKVLGKFVQNPRFAKLFHTIPGATQAAQAAVPVLGEAAALTGVGSLTGGDISPEAFAKNIALILGFKVSHKFASDVKKAIKGFSEKEAEALLKDLKEEGSQEKAELKLLEYVEVKEIEQQIPQKKEVIEAPDLSTPKKAAGPEISKEQKTLESLDKMRSRLEEKIEGAEGEKKGTFEKHLQEVDKRIEDAKKKIQELASRPEPKKEAKRNEEIRDEKKRLEHKPRNPEEPIPLGGAKVPDEAKRALRHLQSLEKRIENAKKDKDTLRVKTLETQRDKVQKHIESLYRKGAKEVVPSGPEPKIKNPSAEKELHLQKKKQLEKLAKLSVEEKKLESNLKQLDKISKTVPDADKKLQKNKEKIRQKIDDLGQERKKELQGLKEVEESIVEMKNSPQVKLAEKRIEAIDRQIKAIEKREKEIREHCL